MSKTSESSNRDSRAARILANSLFRDMRQNGYECSQILALATELIDLVTKDMSSGCETPALISQTQVPQGLRSVG